MKFSNFTEGECSFPGTKVQEINGICTCKEGYTGAQCDECNKGSHLAFGYCNGKLLVIHTLIKLKFHSKLENVMMLEQNIRQHGGNVSAKTHLKEQHVKLALLHGVEIIVINAAMDIFLVMENARVKCLMR